MSDLMCPPPLAPTIAMPLVSIMLVLLKIIFDVQFILIFS